MLLPALTSFGFFPPILSIQCTLAFYNPFFEDPKKRVLYNTTCTGDTCSVSYSTSVINGVVVAQYGQDCEYGKEELFKDICLQSAHKTYTCYCSTDFCNTKQLAKKAFDARSARPFVKCIDDTWMPEEPENECESPSCIYALGNRMCQDIMDYQDSLVDASPLVPVWMDTCVEGVDPQQGGRETKCKCSGSLCDPRPSRAVQLSLPLVTCYVEEHFPSHAPLVRSSCRGHYCSVGAYYESGLVQRTCFSVSLFPDGIYTENPVTLGHMKLISPSGPVDFELCNTDYCNGAMPLNYSIRVNNTASSYLHPTLLFPIAVMVIQR